MFVRPRGVLVVDSDVAVRRTIVRKLVSDGIRADIAGNASDAMRLLDAGRYEVVLLDWQLSDGDGGKIVAHLRRSGEARPERLMVVTAAGSPALRNVDRSLVRGVLFKPLDYAALAAHVRAMLS